jgi:hypothetical protein
MRIKSLLLIFLSFFAAKAADAQLTNQSPYSRFGIGDIYQSGNVGNIAMGGVRTTFNDAFMVNFENPATLGYTMHTTFQSSLRFQAMRLSEGDNSQEFRNGNFDHFAIAFKRSNSPTGFVLGVTPFSTSGYSIASPTEVENVGTATFRYEGNGGINKAFAGVGHREDIVRYRYFTTKEGVAYDSLRVVKHSFAIGANLNYYFGNLEQTRIIDFNDVTYLDTRSVRNTRMFDFGADFGVHYQTVLKARYNKDKRLLSQWMLQLAAVYTPQLQLGTTIEEVFEQTTSQSGVIFPLDTSFYMEGEGFTRLPARYRVGGALQYTNEKGRHFVFAVDIEQRDWQNFRTFVGGQDLSSGLVSSGEFSMGFQYTPQPVEKGKSMLARTQYRFGVRSTETYLSVGEQQIIDEAFTFGLSIPMLSSRSPSKFHLGIEFGARGENNNELIREEYLNILVGVTLSPFYKNLWFVERKYQ